jgi:hypothetical protein
MTDRSQTDMPHEIADRITRPLARFLKIEAAAGALLFFAALSALVLANSAWSTPFLAFWETSIGLHFGALDFTRSLRHWINDGLMTFFFFVISLELKRELVLGELRNLRTAALPFAAALGGMIVPVSIYLIAHGRPTGYTRMGNRDGHRHGVRDRLPCALRLSHPARSAPVSVVVGDLRRRGSDPRGGCGVRRNAELARPRARGARAWRRRGRCPSRDQKHPSIFSDWVGSFGCASTRPESTPRLPVSSWD